MTIVSMHARRNAFQTKGRSDNGPAESFDQNPRIDNDKDMSPGHDDDARFARLVLRRCLLAGTLDHRQPR
jgi:hypothetical protein